MTVQMERKVLGFDFSDASAAILRKWNFPADIYEPIQYQFKPIMAPEYGTFACMLKVSKWGADFFMGSDDDDPIPPYNGDPEHLELIGLTQEDFIECMSNARDGIKEMNDLLS